MKLWIGTENIKLQNKLKNSGKNKEKRGGKDMRKLFPV